MDTREAKQETVHTQREKECAGNEEASGNTKDNAIECIREEISDPKLDRHGLPLIPQPTDRRDDPLVSQANRYWGDDGSLCLLTLIV
jgi:hypothetical protein